MAREAAAATAASRAARYYAATTSQRRQQQQMTTASPRGPIHSKGSSSSMLALGLLRAAATSLVSALLFTCTVAGQTTISANNRTTSTATTTSSTATSHTFGFRVLYQSGTSEKDLPICSELSVCNKVDTYDSPWAERQCRCPNKQPCSTSLDPDDGFTITDKTRQFKLCEPVDQLPKCRYFRDVTWTFINYPDNLTQQIMHCACPKNSVAYIIKRQAYQTQQGIGYQYSFACSPQSRLRCLRKEPCRLFTVKKRPQVEEVNSNTLCQCPHGHRCPRHHLEAGVIPGKMYTEDLVRTYSGYCL